MHLLHFVVLYLGPWFDRSVALLRCLGLLVGSISSFAKRWWYANITDSFCEEQHFPWNEEVIIYMSRINTVNVVRYVMWQFILTNKINRMDLFKTCVIHCIVAYLRPSCLLQVLMCTWYPAHSRMMSSQRADGACSVLIMRARHHRPGFSYSTVKRTHTAQTWLPFS